MCPGLQLFFLPIKSGNRTCNNSMLLLLGQITLQSMFGAGLLAASLGLSFHEPIGTSKKAASGATTCFVVKEVVAPEIMMRCVGHLRLIFKGLRHG